MLNSPSSVAAPAGIATCVFIKSDTKGISFGKLAGVPLGAAFQWFEGAGFVEMNDCVELVSQTRFKIMAEPFRLWPVNNPDRTLEPFIAQQRRRFIPRP